MSSDYRLLCMSHDPATLLGDVYQSGSGGLEKVQRAANIIRFALPDPDGLVSELRIHAGCDLLIGVYSYPLIEVGCPGGCPSDYHPNNKGARDNTMWIDAEWLRLLAVSSSINAATEYPTLTEVIKSVSRCWTAQRLHRLRYELGIVTIAEPTPAPDTSHQMHCSHCHAAGRIRVMVQERIPAGTYAEPDVTVGGQYRCPDCGHRQ